MSETTQPPGGTEKFEIDASVVFQLGESLITDAIQALMELVKNCYDADATVCKVNISTSAVEESSTFATSLGTITISDDGTGMTLDAIRTGWLTISNSSKRLLKQRSGTTVKGRTPLGDKGLGRLGTQRLGANLEMVTRSVGSPVQQHVWFSWGDFENERVLSDVKVFRREEPPSFPHGTKLIISGLRDIDQWKSEGVTELQTRLSQMISPYKAVRNFMVLAEVDGHELHLLEITSKLRNLAQLRYDLKFDGEMFNIQGQARLSYLRPESAASELDRTTFKRLMEDDSGSRFFQFLENRKHAVDFNIKLNPTDGWFVSFSKVLSLEHIDKVSRVRGMVANPGAFSGEIDFFSLGSESAAEAQDLYSAAEYRSTIRKLSGIKIYRDGFGIRMPNDWLNLGGQWTSAKSYYTLKPENTLGYIAISAKDNPSLQEKTDREGFTDTQYLQNFMSLMFGFLEFSGNVQGFLRRGYNDFRKEHEAEVAQVPKTATPESLALGMGKALSHAAQHHAVVSKASLQIRESVSKADELIANLATGQGPSPSEREIRAIVSRLRDEILEAGKGLVQAERYLTDAAKLGGAGKVLAGQIQDLREQIQQVYEVISLGLTAEALSHEIGNVVTQLGERTKKTTRTLRASGTGDLKLFTFLEYVESAINALRRQMAFLEPSLKYAREKRSEIDMTDYRKEILEHYTLHFLNSQIQVSVGMPRRSERFVIQMNKGKLVQVMDNLVLNSEYWLKESFRKGAKRGTIDIELRKPFIIISDSGEGIDPTVENSLFEPFVSTKGRGRGRGLGLYIAEQLLRADGCDIRLSEDRNAKGRRFRFEIDLSGVLT